MNSEKITCAEIGIVSTSLSKNDEKFSHDVLVSKTVELLKLLDGFPRDKALYVAQNLSHEIDRKSKVSFSQTD